MKTVYELYVMQNANWKRVSVHEDFEGASQAEGKCREVEDSLVTSIVPLLADTLELDGRTYLVGPEVLRTVTKEGA